MDFTKLTVFLDSLEERFGIPASGIYVTKDHEIVYHHLTGFKDPEKTIPSSDEDWFRLYSCTKVLTAVGVMKLVEAGKLRLDDPLFKYLPEFDNMRVYDQDYTKVLNLWTELPPENAPCHYAKRPIRIIDLLSMEGGLSYNLNPPEVQAVVADNPHAGTTEIIRALAKRPLYFEPGENYMYSLCHDVLAAVIEAVTGERYSTYMKHEVFDPVGAEDICFLPDASLLKKFSARYQRDSMTGRLTFMEERIGDGITDQYESAGGGGCGTILALSKVLEALANGGTSANGNILLKPETVQMFTASVGTGKAHESFQSLDNIRGYYSYGLGVRVRNTTEGGKSPVGSFGWKGAAGGYAMVDTKNKISIAYANHILNYPEVYLAVHMQVRDLAYEAMGL